MEIYKNLEKQFSLLRLFVLTFLGVGINVLYLVFALWQTVQPPHQTISFGAPEFGSVLLYFVLGIAYSVPATLLSKPKRIVSPIYMQIVTAVIITTILSTALLINQGSTTVTPQNAGQIVVILMAVFFLLGMTGFVQTEIVRWIVALNGSDDDLDKLTFTVDTPYSFVAKIMKEPSFISLGFFNVKEEDEMLVFRGKIPLTSEKLIFVLAPHLDYPTKSTLATICYESHYYYISKSENAARRRGSILSALKTELQLHNSSYDLQEDSLDNKVSRHARDIALKVTQPKMFAIKYIPRHILIAIVSTAILFGIMVYGRYDAHFVTADLFKSSLVLIAIAILFEFVPLWNEARQSKVKV